MSIEKNIMYIAGHGGFYSFDPEKHRLKKIRSTISIDDRMMGLVKHKDTILIGSNNNLFKYDGKSCDLYQKFSNHPGLHEMIIRDDELIATAAARNELWVFDLKTMDLVRRVIITPPNAKKPVAAYPERTNYSHINSITYNNGHYYVGLSRFKNQKWGLSGVAVLDDNLNEVDRFQYGWQLHSFMIMDKSKYGLCQTSDVSSNFLQHPRQSGLMVDGKIVFKHSTNIFCHDFVKYNNKWYLVGSDNAGRPQRRTCKGHIFILDENFKLLDEYHFKEVGGFCGILAVEDD